MSASNDGSAGDDLPTEVSSPAPGPAALRRLPARYAVGELLGAGGMGEVRVCRDDHIGRPVALKVLRAGASAERFVREARIQGQLEHPSILPVYELGTDDPERPWFTMRRIRGVTLAEVVKALAAGDEDMTARYPRRRLLTAFTSVCLTVDYAHARGVLHRDLKPSNIMLGEFGEVHVLDWGVARALGHDDALRADRVLAGELPATEAGSVVGTPGYMSPEQARGDLDVLDAPTDVYSLGAILYEILTLAPLHVGRSPATLIEATLAGADARPSARAPGANVPPELEKICVRATAFDPRDRYPSARELSDAVERFLDGDRDLALRSKLADGHEQAAREALALAGAPGEQGRAARATAMRELTSALALSPGRKNVAAMMARLLMEPPAETPPEVEEELQEKMARERGRGARLLPLAYLVWLGFALVLSWMGLRSVGWTVATLAVVICGMVAAFAYGYRGRVEIRQGAVLLALVCGAITLFSGIFGPLILVPTVALATIIFYTVYGAALKLRIVLTAAGLACFLVPLGLEVAGVVPPSMKFDGEQLIIYARVVGFPPLPSWIFVVAATVAAVALPLWLVHRGRGDLWHAERQLLVQAWHHQQLVAANPADGKPAEARPNST